MASRYDPPEPKVGSPHAFQGLMFDDLGCIKVLKAKKGGRPKVCKTWGEEDGDDSKGVVTAYLGNGGLFAVARKNGTVDVISSIDGNQLYHLRKDEILIDCTTVGDMIDSSMPGAPLDDADMVIGLHLFDSNKKMLTCKRSGSMSIYTLNNAPKRTAKWAAPGLTFLCTMSATEQHILYGGVRDMIGQCTVGGKPIWQGNMHNKDRRVDAEPCFTCGTFMEQDVFVAANNIHEVHLFDVRAQKLPVMSMTFFDDYIDWRTSITAIATNQDNRIVYIGNESGDIGIVDVREGKLIGCFEKLTSSSLIEQFKINLDLPPKRPIKFISRHPAHPIIATGGSDDLIRIWDVATRRPLSTINHQPLLTKFIFSS